MFTPSCFIVIGKQKVFKKTISYFVAPAQDVFFLWCSIALYVAETVLDDDIKPAVSENTLCSLPPAPVHLMSFFFQKSFSSWCKIHNKYYSTIKTIFLPIGLGLTLNFYPRTSPLLLCLFMSYVMVKRYRTSCEYCESKFWKKPFF